MSEKIVLYDIPSKDSRGCWSANVWKVRLVLNYKNIPYKTKWIEFPDIEPTFKGLGIPPNEPPKWSDWSVPVIQLPDGTYIMHSTSIIAKLEELYPSPTLHLDKDLHGKAEAAHVHLAIPTMPYFMPRLRRDVVTAGSSDWFKADRERRFGMSEAQWESEKGGCVAWAAAEPALKEHIALLAENKVDDGPFILGSQPSYGDLILAGMIDMFKCIGDDAYERYVEYDPALSKLYEACSKWLARRT